MSKTSKLIAYKNTDRVCCCQIKFSSRERILISVASVPEPSIKVIKLLAGFIPYKTIWEFTATKNGGKDPHRKLISMFTNQTVPKVNNPLDAIILKLVPCGSCDEAVDVLYEAERASRNS